jgi:hypothetical protein
MAVDALMTVALLCLVSYELIGQTTHEVTGVTMMVLFVLHHILNRKWTSAVTKGKYRPYRIFQTALVTMILILMISQACSGVMLSKHLFLKLPFHQGYGLARTVHMIGGYWGFVLMSMHLGLHWNIILSRFGKGKKKSIQKTRILRLIAGLIAIYGVIVLFKREIILYLTLRNPFVYFDFDEPLVFFFFDYLMVMGLFVMIGYYLGAFLRRKK